MFLGEIVNRLGADHDADIAVPPIMRIIQRRRGANKKLFVDVRETDLADGNIFF